MTRETGEGGPLEVAIHRLDRALAQLDVRLGALASAAGTGAGELFDQDRAKLAAELDATRGRERALHEASVQASRALGRAIVEIRATLEDERDDEGEAGEAAPAQQGEADPWPR
jgi:hypothetical protein